MRLKYALPLLGVLALGGCGGTKTITNTTTTSTMSVTETSTDTRTVVRYRQQAPTVTKTVNNTITTTPAASSDFSGSGTKSVGTVNVSRDSTLSWTCSGSCSTFMISNDPNDADSISLSASDRHGGTTAVTAGAYHQVQVIADGDWTFKIS